MRLLLGNCRTILPTLPDNSVDAVVTDPPAGIGFMGKEWDDFRRARNDADAGRDNVFGRTSTKGPEYGRRRKVASWQYPHTAPGFTDGAQRLVAPAIGTNASNPMCRKCHRHKRGWKTTPGCECETPDFDDRERVYAARDVFVRFLTDVLSECLRVLKPGGHALVWAIPRTSHWTATACEDAGFEIRDKVYHLFGTGFPKSLDVSRAIDKAAGADRVVIGTGRPVKRMIPGADQNATGSWIKDNGREFVPTITAPATDAATQWDGWGTALKPAAEEWILCRKPLSEKSVALNVLRWGTGALNIDATRITLDKPRPLMVRTTTVVAASCMSGASTGATSSGETTQLGRWPANVVHDGSEEVLAEFPDSTTRGHTPALRGNGGISCDGHAGQDGIAERWHDTGSAARFFFCAKASRADREEGLGDLAVKESVGTLAGDADGSLPTGAGNPRNATARNHHPTVKNTALMRWLCRLITPPGGTVLDPFMGSGSTGKAAMLEGFDFVGIEQDESYMEIARRRIAVVDPADQPATAQSSDGKSKRLEQLVLPLGGSHA